MKRALTVLMMTAALIVAMASGAKADPINGTISISGGATFSNYDLTTGSNSVNFTSGFVGSASNDFNGALFTQPTVEGFSWTLGTGGKINLPGGNMWTVTNGSGTTYSFQASSMVVTGTPGVGSLDLSGNGILYISSGGNVIKESTGTFTLDFTSSTDSLGGHSGGYTLSLSSNGDSVPEASTLLLFGAGLLGLVFVERRKKLER